MKKWSGFAPAENGTKLLTDRVVELCILTKNAFSFQY